jgi:hypothetical protein
MALSSDDLQRVTHALCYIYARATKGVSYCSPAYYADRLCDRGRAWLRDYLMGRLWIDQRPNENFNNFKTRARNEIDRGSYWRPQRNNNQGNQKYGQARKNPWHPNLDDIMFYLCACAAYIGSLPFSITFVLLPTARKLRSFATHGIIGFAYPFMVDCQSLCCIFDLDHTSDR